MSVSVIIANRNNAPFIEQCIMSVAPDPAVGEIILYDDCSTDSSVQIVERLGLAKVRVIRGTTNLGPTLARQAAVSVSVNGLLCFLDGDDYLSEQAVTLGRARLLESGADFSLFELVRVSVDGRDVLSTLAAPRECISGAAAFELTLGGWGIHTLGVMRRGAYDHAMQGFTAHGHSDDEVLWRRVLLHSDNVCANEGKYFYRKVDKPVTPSRIEGLARNRIRTIRMAADAGIAGARLSHERAMLRRNLAGIAFRTLTGRFRLGAAFSLMTDYARLP